MLVHLLKFFSRNQPTAQHRFNLLRNFSVFSLSGFVLSIVLLSILYKQQATGTLVMSTEENNVILTNVFAKNIWPEYGIFLTSTQRLSNQELAADPLTQKLYNQLTTQLENSPIAKVKVFDLQGRTVFSTNINQLGSDKSQSPGFLSAKNGRPLSQLNHRDTFKAIEQVLEDRHLLSSYIPIRDNEKIVAVFELYTDVTPLLLEIERTSRKIVLGSLLILGLLYLILNLFVRQADTKLKNQYQQLQDSENRYRQQSLELDHRVKQRTQELSQTLEELRNTQTVLIHQEKMSALGELVAGVAHEINNPVNFIHGNLYHVEDYSNTLLEVLDLYQQYYPHPHANIYQHMKTLDMDFIQQDLGKMLASMKVGTKRIQEIVLSLCNFSRKDQADIKMVNIHEGIESTLMILQHRLKPHPPRPTISVERNFDNLPLVECYAGQLNQVFMNILSNRIDALDSAFGYKTQATQNSPKITITTIAWEQTIRITIADNGTAMSEVVKPYIFKPFSDTKALSKDTSIAMTISHHLIVEKHGGKIDCIYQEDVGTQFIIEIPVLLRKNLEQKRQKVGTY